MLTAWSEPIPFINCKPDSNGTVKRTPLIYSYIDLAQHSVLYSKADDTRSIAHLTVANDGRVYYLAQDEIVDYPPGAACPTNALTIAGLSTYSNGPLALDADNNLYAADTANNVIYVYPPGTRTHSHVLRQTISSQGVQLVVQ